MLVAEVTLTPGACRSTQGPKLEEDQTPSSSSLAPTVSAEESLPGLAPQASEAALPAAATTRAPPSTRAWAALSRAGEGREEPTERLTTAGREKEEEEEGKPFSLSSLSFPSLSSPPPPPPPPPFPENSTEEIQSSPATTSLTVAAPSHPTTRTGTTVAFLASPKVSPAASAATCVPCPAQSKASSSELAGAPFPPPPRLFSKTENPRRTLEAKEEDKGAKMGDQRNSEWEARTPVSTTKSVTPEPAAENSKLKLVFLLSSSPSS